MEVNTENSRAEGLLLFEFNQSHKRSFLALRHLLENHFKKPQFKASKAEWRLIFSCACSCTWSSSNLLNVQVPDILPHIQSRHTSGEYILPAHTAIKAFHFPLIFFGTEETETELIKTSIAAKNGTRRMHVHTQEDKMYPSRRSKQESRDHNKTRRLLIFLFLGNLVVLQIFWFFFPTSAPSCSISLHESQSTSDTAATSHAVIHPFHLLWKPIDSF